MTVNELVKCLVVLPVLSHSWQLFIIFLRFCEFWQFLDFFIVLSNFDSFRVTHRPKLLWFHWTWKRLDARVFFLLIRILVIFRKSMFENLWFETFRHQLVDFLIKHFSKKPGCRFTTSHHSPKETNYQFILPKLDNSTLLEIIVLLILLTPFDVGKGGQSSDPLKQQDSIKNYPSFILGLHKCVHRSVWYRLVSPL